MAEREVPRRQFMKGAAVGAAGVAGFAAGLSRTSAVRGADVDSSKVLNFNPDMEYRRLGKTGIHVSALCLGGHSRSDDKERAEIVARCLDAGINYIDACSYHEVVRDAKALGSRRDKVYLALSDCGREVRNEKYRKADKLLEVLEDLLKASKQEYTDLWRITCFEPGGRHTFNTACEIVEALEKAKKQGKARHIGLSTHDRRWIQFMIQYFPQIEVVCFPFTTMSKAAPKDSVFEALKKCDVGAFGIKPFAASSLFSGDAREDDRRARLALRYILHTDTVIPIPGMNSLAQVENCVKAVNERRELDLKERAELESTSKEMWARLPKRYDWLRDWEYV